MFPLLAQVVPETVTGSATEAGKETWSAVVHQVRDVIGAFLPNLAAAIAVLVVGWILALIISAMVAGVIRRLGIGKRFSDALASESGMKEADVAGRFGKITFWLLMLFVLIGFFQTLGLTTVTVPLTAFLNEVFAYLPRLIAAGVVLLLAWVIASILRFIVLKALLAANLDERLSHGAGVDDEHKVHLSKNLSEATYWIVLLLFLPFLLSALAVEGLLTPVQDMVTQVLGFLPKLFAAAMVLGIGWFVARVVQRVVSNLLASVGTDRLSDRVGMNKVLGEKNLSGLIGLLAYALILIPVIVAALNALQIEAVTAPASDMLKTMLGALPGIFAAFLIIAVAYIAGRIVSGIVANVLAAIGFDTVPARLGITSEAKAGRRKPSEIVGQLAMVAIVLFAIMQAMPILGFVTMGALMAEFLRAAFNVLVGLAIFGLGIYIAKLVADTISDSGIARAELLATVSRVAILVLAGAMALQRADLAPEITQDAFRLSLGAVAVAVAIAFGVGGKDVAREMLEKWTKSGRQGP
jgi:Mechanosensitive ion channel, conserved TM helix